MDKGVEGRMDVYQWRTEGVWRFKTPPRIEIPKALKNRAKHNPTVKTVKKC